MSVRSLYGLTKKQQDESLFYNKRKFSVLFEGQGNVSSTGPILLYLKIDKMYQGLYVPAGIVASVKWTAIHFFGSTTTVQEEQGTLVRATGGNVTYTGGAIGTMNPTITPTANTTVQALEMVVQDADSTQVTYSVVRGDFIVIDVNATGQSQLVTGAATALTTAE